MRLKPVHAAERSRAERSIRNNAMPMKISKGVAHAGGGRGWSGSLWFGLGNGGCRLTIITTTMNINNESNNNNNICFWQTEAQTYTNVNMCVRACVWAIFTYHITCCCIFIRKYKKVKERRAQVNVWQHENVILLNILQLLFYAIIIYTLYIYLHVPLSNVSNK